MKPITRIRYTEHQRILLSNSMFAKTEMVRAYINLESLYWTIKNDKDKAVTSRVDFKTEAQAKKAVKHKLKDLGVEFETEVRSKERTTPNQKQMEKALSEFDEIFPYAEEHKEQDLIDLDMEETDEWLRNE